MTWGTVGVGGNQRGVFGIVPEAWFVGLIFRTVAGDLLLSQRKIILSPEPPQVS